MLPASLSVTFERSELINELPNCRVRTSIRLTGASTAVEWATTLNTDILTAVGKVVQPGVKGIGEAGTIGSAAAVMNAVCDALSPYGITDLTMPATPMKVWRAIQSSSGGTEQGGR